MTVGALFAGYGGLELALGLVLPTELRWVVDNDPGAARVLVEHYPDVPNLGDVEAIDWTTVEPVDVMTGGFPCQDVSHAGARAGMRRGNRSGLWSRMVEAIDELRPELVVVENVRGLLSAKADSAVEPCAGCMGDGPERPALRALGRVLGDLADLRYDAQWISVRAADAGAPHGRLRVFVAACSTDSGRIRGDSRRTAERRGAEGGGSRRQPVGRSSATAADAGHDGLSRGGLAQPARVESALGLVADGPTGAREGRAGARTATADAEPVPHVQGRGDAAAVAAETPRRVPADRDQARAEPGGSGSVDRGRRAADAGSLHAGIDWGGYERAIRRWEHVLGRAAPEPTEIGPRGGQVLSAEFVEWMMGLPQGWITRVPGLARTNALQLLGNGVVPQQAAIALRAMIDRLET